jgi:hypothetical protein
MHPRDVESSVRELFILLYLMCVAGFFGAVLDRLILFGLPS